ncbi:hypothetical protein GCM10023080_026630 [Streptomyces pseudoechinosporeus]
MNMCVTAPKSLADTAAAYWRAMLSTALDSMVALSLGEFVPTAPMLTASNQSPQRNQWRDVSHITLVGAHLVDGTGAESPLIARWAVSSRSTRSVTAA